MTKTLKQKRPAERPEKKEFLPAPQEKIISMSALLRQKHQAHKGSLTLRVTIPAKVVPLFKALAEVTKAANLECFAAWALCKGCTSEEAMDQFDQLVNVLL